MNEQHLLVVCACVYNEKTHEEQGQCGVFLEDEKTLFSKTLTQRSERTKCQMMKIQLFICIIFIYNYRIVFETDYKS